MSCYLGNLSLGITVCSLLILNVSEPAIAYIYCPLSGPWHRWLCLDDCFILALIIVTFYVTLARWFKNAAVSDQTSADIPGPTIGVLGKTLPSVIVF